LPFPKEIVTNYLFGLLHADVSTEEVLPFVVFFLVNNHADADFSHCAGSTNFNLNSGSTLSEGFVVFQRCIHLFFNEVLVVKKVT
jgi:hypothetical protein